MAAPFPDFTEPTDDADARRIAARTGLPLADVRAALRRLADARHRDAIRRRTGT
jgi:hypothetical protein